MANSGVIADIQMKIAYQENSDHLVTGCKFALEHDTKVDIPDIICYSGKVLIRVDNDSIKSSEA